MCAGGDAQAGAACLRCVVGRAPRPRSVVVFTRPCGRSRAGFLAEASRTLAQSLDYGTTLATVAGPATPELGAWVLVDLVEEDGAVRRLAVIHPDPTKQALARELERGYPPAVEDALGAPVVLRTREPTLVSQLIGELLIGGAPVRRRRPHAGRGPGHPVRYDLQDVVVREAVTEAEGLILPQARANGLALAVDDCPGSLTVRADPEKLRQVLVSLLSNASKFTSARDGRPGCIEVTCAAGPGGWVAIRVRDTGIGIAADKLGAILEPFVQVRSDLTRTAEGTGLGLAISRDLARGMGGDLTAESTPGVGSTFTLTLPSAP